MLYTHLDLWTDPAGNIWQALRTPGTRDLSMSVLKPYEVKRAVAWARAQRMTISDLRTAKGTTVTHGIADRAIDLALAPAEAA